MSYQLDAASGKYIWVDDGQGNIEADAVKLGGTANIKLNSNGQGPKELGGKPAQNSSNAPALGSSPTSTPAPNSQTEADRIRQEVLDKERQNSGNALTGDYQVLRTPNQSKYVGSTFVTEKGDSQKLSEIQSYFKNLSELSPELVKWREALKGTTFGQGFPKKKNPTKAQIVAALTKAANEAAITGTTLDDLVFNNKDYASAPTTGTGLTSKQLNNYKATIESIANKIGVVDIKDADITKLAKEYSQGGMTADVLQNRVAQIGKINFAEGAAATQKASLKQWAADNGMSFDDTWYNTAVNNILTGKDAIDTYKATITDQAKGLYSAEYFTKGLDAGFSIRQQASPYINYLAKIRGVDPTSVSLEDPMLMKNLTKRDDKGNPVIPSYYDFTLDVRKNDPTWGYSFEAQEETTKMLNQFGKAFGKVSG